MDKEREELLRTRTWSNKVRQENAPAPSDTALQERHEQSAEFNARVHQVLAEIPVPPTLRAQICARRNIIQVPSWREPRRFWAVAAMAALLAILATGLFLWNRPPAEDTTYAAFRSQMVGFALREYSMDIHTNQLGEVRAHLAANGAPANFQLPSPLAQAPVKGCKRLSWHGNPVGMVCFGASNGETLDMFVIDSAHAVNAADFNLEIIKNLPTATWQSGGKTFLLAGNIPVTELEKLVKS
mgnify:CR=1 FL=1